MVPLETSGLADVNTQFGVYISSKKFAIVVRVKSSRSFIPKTVFVSVLFCGAFGPIFSSFAQNCDEVLKHGIFNTELIQSNAGLQESFDEWTYDMNFQKMDDAIKAGISVGTVVYGVPVQLGGTFDKSSKDQWYQQHAQFAHKTTTVTENYSKLTKQVSRDLLAAWTKCVTQDKNRPGFAAYLDAVGDASNNLAVLEIAWSVPPPAHGTDLKISNIDVQGGTVLDQVQFHKLRDGGILRNNAHERLSIQRIRNQDLLAIVTSTKGGSTSAVLPAVFDPPTIAKFDANPDNITVGQSLTLNWETQKSVKVEIVGSGAGNAVNASSGSLASVGHLGVKPTAAGSMLYTLKATGQGGDEATQKVPVTVNPPVSLTFTSVIFHTGDRSKDGDTALDFEIQDSRNGQVVADYRHGNNPEDEFQKGTDTTKPLQKQRDFLASDIPFLRVHIIIGPNGSNTWTFSFTVNGGYSDGRPFSKSYGGTSLSDENKEGFY